MVKLTDMNAELSRSDAYGILELPIGADRDSIRTSYKRLAMKWHPDKHNNTPESVKRFSQISFAYARMSSDSSNITLSFQQMFDQYKQVVYPQTAFNSNGFHSSDDDDSDFDEDDDDIPYNRVHQVPTTDRKLTAEEVERHADELLRSEEREKNKAEKKRAKKKRRREKKRLEKQEKTKTEEDTKSKLSPSNQDAHKRETLTQPKSESSCSDESFDESAAFFTRVVNKKKKNLMENTNKPRVPEIRETTTEKSDDLTEKITNFAIRGFKMANEENYQAAINLFSEAISLDPTDHRFFGNRSYCYDRLQQYDKALKDAERYIELKSEGPKGYFRKARSLAGLKQYNEAEKGFLQVLKLEPNCEDAKNELKRVRIQMLCEMGFSRQLAETALLTHSTVQQALESLLAGMDTSLTGEVYVSDDEDYSTAPTPSSPPRHTSTLPSALPTVATANPADKKMDPRNPEGLTALWVGNVLPEVTSKQLETLFSKHGPVTSVRCLPEKYCAFINFKNKESASRAIAALQGTAVAGQNLLIKFPDNPVTNNSNHSNHNNNIVLKKPVTTTKKHPVTQRYRKH